VIFGRQCGASPSTVVKFAIREKSRPGNDFDYIWCVFDCNGHGDLEEAFSLAQTNNIGVAFSNPNFELWYLLHFQDQTASLRGKSSITRLKKFIRDYPKSQNVYPLLAPRQSEAITRAGKLRKMHLRNDTTSPKHQNPSTTADELVVFLNSLVR